MKEIFAAGEVNVVTRRNGNAGVSLFRTYRAWVFRNLSRGTLPFLSRYVDRVAKIKHAAETVARRVVTSGRYMYAPWTHRVACTFARKLCGDHRTHTQTHTHDTLRANRCAEPLNRSGDSFALTPSLEIYTRSTVLIWYVVAFGSRRIFPVIF